MALPFGLPSLGSPRLLASWFGAGAFTVVLPILIFVLARVSNAAANYQDNNNGNNNNQNNNNNNNNGEDDEESTPWWYFFGGNGEDSRDEERAPAVLVAVYLWSLLLFFGILLYGRYVMRAGADLHGLVVALCLFANFGVISLFMVSGVEGGVETEGRAVDEHGFAGQVGVLIYLTMLFWIIFSVFFGILLHRLNHDQHVEKIEVEPSDLKPSSNYDAMQDKDPTAV